MPLPVQGVTVMAYTLAEAAKYTNNVLARSLVEELMRSHPWLAEYELQRALEWSRKPWYERAYLRTKYWLQKHTPHVHVYLGEHPRDDD